MQKFIWLLAIAFLPSAHYGCGAQTPTNVAAPPQSATATPLPTRIPDNTYYPRDHYTLYRDPNGRSMHKFDLDTLLGYRITMGINSNGCDYYFRKEADTTIFTHLSEADVLKKSPYFNLPYPTVNYHPSEAIKNFDVRKLSPQQKQALLKDVVLDTKISNHQLGYLVASEPQITQNYRYVVASYDLLFSNTDGDIFGAACQIVVYNAKGEQIAQIKDTKHGCSGIAVTENGYIGQQYGLVWDEQGAENLDFGMNFYQIGNTKILYNFHLDAIPTGVGGVGNSIYWGKGSETQPLGTVYYIFDVANRCYYTKDISMHQLENTRSKDAEGFVLKDGSFYSFKDNFEKINFVNP